METIEKTSGVNLESVNDATSEVSVQTLNENDAPNTSEENGANEIEGGETAATDSTIIDVQETIAGGAYLSVNATALEKYIAVYKQGDSIMRNGMLLKMIALATINQLKLYSEKGYKTIYEFAAAELKLSKQTAYRYIETAKNFYDVDSIAREMITIELIDKATGNVNLNALRNFNPRSIFADSNGNDFATTVLNDIAALPVETVKNLLASGELNYDMTVKQIRNAVKPYRNNADKKPRSAEKSGSEVDNEKISVQTLLDDTGATTANTTAMALDTIEKLKAELAKLKAENDALAAENQQLLDNAALQQDKIDALTAENATLRNSNNSYKAANSKAKKAIDTLKNSNDALTTENDTLKAENDTLKAAIDTGSEIDVAGEVVTSGVKLITGEDTSALNIANEGVSVTSATFNENVIDTEIAPINDAAKE